MNCATTNQATFENRCPFEGGAVCSEAIHRIHIALLRTCTLLGTHTLLNAFTTGAMNCATTNHHAFENRYPFEGGAVCSEAIYRIHIALLRTTTLLRTHTLLNAFTTGAMNCATTNLHAFGNAYAFERIYDRRNELRYYEPPRF